MYDDIINLLDNYKHNCFTFTNKPVDEGLINDIVNKMYDYVPSKQSKVPWQLDILGPNRSIEDKKVIYNLTYNKLHTENGRQVGRPNPQSDAPYVFIFSHRYLSNAEIGDNLDLTDDSAMEWAAASEIGFASYILKLLTNSAGLDFGFCGCIDSEFFDSTRKYFGKEKSWRPKLVCGVGYGSYNTHSTVRNYNVMDIETFVRPGSIPKPDLSNIIKKHY